MKGFMILPAALCIWAFLSFSDRITNGITAAFCDVAVETDGKLPESEDVRGIVGTRHFDCTARVKNTGNCPCRIRVYVCNSESAAMEATELLGTDPGWVRDGDFYSWQEEVAPGDVTGNVMTGLDIQTLTDRQADNFYIGVYAEGSAGR